MAGLIHETETGPEAETGIVTETEAEIEVGIDDEMMMMIALALALGASASQAGQSGATLMTMTVKSSGRRERVTAHYDIRNLQTRTSYRDCLVV